ncbi:MAG TPA: histidine phosphatase family protein, partial [Ktedonobacterales bacterium]|nr:histidine phosphatase family protein [Ktedonobacterales bacterium]
MNTIYLVRHGENTANLTKEFSYKLVDYPLTDKGIVQAQQTAAYFQGKDIDEIFTSPLKRAVQTAEIIGAALGLKAIVVEQFREVNVGLLEQRPPDAQAWSIYGRVMSDWRQGKHDTAFPEGEDYVTLLKRFRSGLHEITRGKSQKNIIVVGHGGIFMATIQAICPHIERGTLTNDAHNCSISEITMDA